MRCGGNNKKTKKNKKNGKSSKSAVKDRCGPGTGTRCGGHKKNAAQKRQDKRDEQRRKKGISRTDDMAHRERERKHAQANNRMNDRADPYEPGFGDRDYARKRENKRAYRCRMFGEDCDWKALDWDNNDKAYDYDHVHDEHYPDV